MNKNKTKAEVYFTSDTHFGSERTLILSKRPFNSVKEMDETIIKNWNEVVGEDDIVFHLGDFGDYERIKELNGRVILILGNYEYSDIIQNYHSDLSYFSCNMVDLGFFLVKEEYAQGDFHLTHKPSDCLKDKFNLFGHIHKLQMVKEFGLNVGVDSHNFTPIDLDTVHFYKGGIELHYDEDVFIRKLEG